MKWSKIILLAILVSGCTIIETVDENGILWEFFTVNPITIGVETMPMDNLILFADSTSMLFALDAGSGLLRWRVSPPITITTILPLDGQLYIIGHSNTGAQESVIYTIDTLNGSIAAQRSFPIKPLANKYLSTPDGALLYSSSQAVFVSNNGTLGTTHSLLNGIIAIQQVGASYYALIREIDNSTRIQRYSLSFSALGSATRAENPSGSIFPWHSSLYIGTTTSLLRSDITPALSLFRSLPVRAGMAGSGTLLFVPSADAANGGIRSFDIAGTQQWFTPTFAAISFAPLVYNSSFNVVFSIDDNGNLGVYDATTGRLLFQRYLGSIQRPGLKLPMDLFQNHIFVPFSSPSRLVCFSIRHASVGR